MSDTYPFVNRDAARIGFGAMQLPGPRVMGPPRDHDSAIAVLRRAVELGANHIDTSQYYGPDIANQLIAEALYPYPSNLLLVSKVGAKRNARGAWLPAQQPEELKSAVHENLATLKVEQLAAVNLRILDAGHQLPVDQDVSLDDRVAAMVELRDEGAIAGVGISNATLDEVRHIHESIGLACVQNAFNFLNQADSAVVDYCTANRIPFVPFFPLGSGFPQNPKVPDDARVIEVAGRLGTTPGQVGLAWLLRRAPNILLIPGTSSLAHLEENMAAGRVRLGDDDLVD